MKDTAIDISFEFVNNMQNLAASSRVFDFTTLLMLFMCVVATFLSFTIKTHTHPKAGISQLSFMLHHLLNRDAKKQYILGMTIDKMTHIPISQARIFVIDDNTKNVLYETFTNKKGSFLLKKPFIHYHIMAVKNGFEPSVLYPTTTDLLYVTLHANTTQSVIKVESRHTLHRLFAMLFETILVFTFILELFFTNIFGIEKTWPFVVLSVLNVLLWFYYLSIKHHEAI
jgi:hypothetical protein